MFIYALKLCVYGNMMQGIEWQGKCHEIMKKDRVDISLGTMGIESWCLF